MSTPLGTMILEVLSTRNNGDLFSRYSNEGFVMEINRYPPPVDKLLTYGDCRELYPWPDYLELGLGPEHIPDLIRMATDEELRWADSESLEVWAPIHAWRALGQLRAEAAIEPLLPLFEEAEDDDWVIEELPVVYGMIGPPAIAAIAAYIGDESHTDWARIVAARSLEEIGNRFLEAKDECIAALIGQLELFDENDPELNAFIINDLIELKAVQALPLMKRAFAGEYVEESVVGGWDDVQRHFGLKPNAKAPQSSFTPMPGAATKSTNLEIVTSTHLSYTPTPQRHKGTHKKTINKMAKQSRNKNRKRK